jgi:hypothetical protein
MAHRGQWSEHEARGALVAWRRSGLSIERFAKKRGLVPQRIRWWKNKLEGKPTAGASTQSLALLNCCPAGGLGRASTRNRCR